MAEFAPPGAIVAVAAISIAFWSILGVTAVAVYFRHAYGVPWRSMWSAFLEWPDLEDLVQDRQVDSVSPTRPAILVNVIQYDIAADYSFERRHPVAELMFSVSNWGREDQDSTNDSDYISGKKGNSDEIYKDGESAQEAAPAYI